MAVRTENPVVLLRRPLPPKILSPLSSSREKHGKANTRKEIICRKRDKLAPLRLPSEREEHDIDMSTTRELYKPQGPDPLPARSPKHGRENPYELPVDKRFTCSPVFTLDDFLNKLEEVEDDRCQSLERRKFVLENNRENWTFKQQQQRQMNRHVYANNTELPNPSPRKPQKQIIIELAAAILSNEGEILDMKLTEILNQVEAPKFPPATWTSSVSHATCRVKPPLDVRPNTTDEWSNEYSGTSGATIADLLSRNRRRTEIIEPGKEDYFEKYVIIDSETYPGVEPLLSRTSMLHSQGRARCSSPFENDKKLMTPAEFLVFDSFMKCHNTLDLKGYFISELPDIQDLTKQLTVVNLSFNNFTSFPCQVFAIKHLVSLNLRDNPLKEIPFEIAKLSNLQTLNLSFCLISSLPLSLFTLKRLKILDISYNYLSFLPKDIGKLRSLVELSVEGNELCAFPASFVTLKLSYLRVMNNFTHPLFWREATSREPQRLFHMAAQIVVTNSQINATSEEIKTRLYKQGVCDCCDGPVVGPGVRMIKAIPEIFNVKTLPLVFVVCSQTCRRAFKKDQQAIDNWLKKNLPENIH